MRRAATVVTVAMALVVPAVVLGAPGDEGAARADDSVGRPADGMFTVQGHGFGHGRGMSQYGAYGAASQGGSAQQILDFYYPGTGSGSASLSQIRVALTDDNTDVDVSFNANMWVTDVATGAKADLPQGADRWRVRRSGSGLALQYLQNGDWIPWNIPNTSAPYAGPVKFVDPDSPTIRVNLPDGPRGYRGSVMGVTSGSGLRTVNELPLDDYLRGVVPRESPASWPAAALQAQAVAARSYAVYLAEHKSGTFWDLCDTTACQVYGGANSEVASTDAAVSATSMQVRTYGGRAIFAEFSSSNGGYTAAGSMPYFVAKPDPYDGVSGSSAHSWTLYVSANSIENAYPEIGRVQAVTILARDGRGEWGGRVTGKVRFSGSNGNVEVTGDQVRSTFGLKSNWFLFIGGGPAIQARYNGDPDLQNSLGAPVGAEQYSNGVAWQAYQNGRLYWSSSTGVHLLRGGILEAYLDAGGPNVFGAPTSDEAYGSATSAYNLFANNVIFIWSADTGAHYVRGSIRARWSQLGSEWGRLGFPTSSEVYIAGGVYASFTGGRIYWSESTGAWEVVGAIGAEWVARGGPQSGSGFPVGGDVPAGGGGAYQKFASGWTMFWSSATGAHVVRGGVQAKWRETGAEWGPLGYPDGDEVYVAGGGTAQRFARGSVLWSPPTGAHTMLDGPAATAWDGLGGSSAVANMPTTDQGTTRDGGTWQNFYGDYSLFWSSGSGAHVLRGGIRTYWRSSGAEWGPLGYPTSEEIYGSNGVRQVFQGGTLEWSAATGTVSKVA
jgi:stage II sporulation protein D